MTYQVWFRIRKRNDSTLLQEIVAHLRGVIVGGRPVWKRMWGLDVLTLPLHVANGGHQDIALLGHGQQVQWHCVCLVDDLNTNVLIIKNQNIFCLLFFLNLVFYWRFWYFLVFLKKKDKETFLHASMYVFLIIFP